MAMILTSDHREQQSINTAIKPKRCSSCSIDDLTDELLVEILQRVHCKSVFRCKSVSKHWFTLISDPYFTHSFLRYHTNEKLLPREFVVSFFLKGLLITSQHHPEVRSPLNLSFLPCFQTSQLQEKPCIVGSSNGLLLCCSKTGTDQTIYYVCNPLTKQWTVLPPAPKFEPYHITIGFISYPSHDNSQCSFKVVRLIRFRERKSVFMGETFSSETGQWKDLVLSCPLGFNMSDMSRLAIAYNGMFHWVLDYEKKIFVYDPTHDKVHAIIDYPKDVDPKVIFDCLGLWRGRMRIAQLQGLSMWSHLLPYYSLKVWELKDYTASKWSLIHRINLKKLTWKENSPLPKAKSTTPNRMLAFHPYEDAMYLTFENNVVSCNLQTKTLEFVSEFPDKGTGRHRCYSSDDVSTIVLPPWPTAVPALPAT